MSASTENQRWISFNPVMQSLSEFLAEWKPSQTFAPQIEWLCVSRLKVKSKPLASDTGGLMMAWKALCISKMNIVTGEDVHRLATEYKVISGKWMLFIHPKRVDEAWTIIASAVIDGILGDDAKVSSADREVEEKKKKGDWSDYDDFLKLTNKQASKKGPSGCHVICVYASDFNDLEAVFGIRETLNHLGFKAKISFKPDAYSFCGVYSGNQWGIPPTIYCA